MGDFKMATATKTVQKLRSFLSGAEYNIALRYTASQHPRTRPPPNLPFGAAHELSDNYYVQRDGRRAHAPPTVVKPVTLQITEKVADNPVEPTFKPSTPGN